MKKLFTVLALIAGLTSAAGIVLAQTRVALVIGNDARLVANGHYRQGCAG